MKVSLSIKSIGAIFLVLFSVSSFALSEPASKTNFPASMSYGGQSTAIRAVGLRKKFVFKVYAFGLYGNSKVSKANIFSPNNFLAIEMKFLRDVGGKDISDAVQKSVKPRLSKTDYKYLAKFGAMFKGKVKEGNSLKFMWIGNGLTVLKNNRRIGTVASNGFAKAFFEVYLGKNPIVSAAKQQFMKTL